MMVADYVERPSSSPSNGVTPLLSSANSNGGLGIGLNNNAIGCTPGTGYFVVESGKEVIMSRDSQMSPCPESPNAENYPPGFDIANHVQRKELFSQRKQREFIPDNKKDESYWDRRRRNNEAAKRSREKRRYNDMILEQRVVELSKENHFLKAQLSAIKDKYGINGEAVVNVEQVMATLPTNDQVLSITKRAKITSGTLPGPQILYPPNSVPIPTPVIHRTSGPSPPQAPPLHPSYAESETFHEQERFPYPFPPVLPPLNPPVLEGNSVLNLSRRSDGYEAGGPGNEVPNAAHNSLPHKLRHKSHLGDKDVAATALLSLHAIKQEPGPRASPPWDAEGSSDERDSGISLGAEWVLSNHQPHPSPHDSIENEDDDSHLKSEVARLASEVATLKSMLSRKKSTSLVIN